MGIETARAPISSVPGRRHETARAKRSAGSAAHHWTTMRQFLLNNREDLIARCKAKVAQRPRRAATAAQFANGIPMFLEQLTRTLGAEEHGRTDESLRISGSSSGDTATLSEIGVSAAAHGGELLRLGFTVDAVVHDYGDLCQAITDLAFERDAPFTIDEFRTLNRCLDNAIADAVSEFGAQRDAREARARTAEENERLGVLVHELRNVLQTATLAFQALELGLLPVGGASGRRSYRGPRRAQPRVEGCDAGGLHGAGARLRQRPRRRGLLRRRTRRRCRAGRGLRRGLARLRIQRGKGRSIPRRPRGIAPEFWRRWPTFYKTPLSSRIPEPRSDWPHAPMASGFSSTCRIIAVAYRTVAPRRCSGPSRSLARIAAAWGSGSPSRAAALRRTAAR